MTLSGHFVNLKWDQYTREDGGNGERVQMTLRSYDVD